MADHPTHPRLYIQGDAPGLPLEFVATGEMVESFQESYAVEITAKDKAAGDGGQSGQTPHPPDMNFDKGAFENLQFTIELFSGCLVNGSELYTGQQLTQVAETLFKISMPRPSGESFVGPPLVTLMYGNFWKARGLFQKASYQARGAWDAFGYPMLQTIRMEFARHFGGGVRAGGVYYNATPSDLRAATAARFRFRG